jgi:hypothetical protein
MVYMIAGTPIIPVPLFSAEHTPRASGMMVHPTGAFFLDHYLQRHDQTKDYKRKRIASVGGEVIKFDGTFREAKHIRVGGQQVTNVPPYIRK